MLASCVAHGRDRDRHAEVNRELFESVAGDLLGELGYETEGLARPLPALKRARLRSASAVGYWLKRLRVRRPPIRNAALTLRAELQSRLRP